MHILIAPGAFKHSLSAADVAQAIARGLEQSNLAATWHLLPIADGGNGTLDAFLATGGERVTMTAHDPLMRPVDAAFGLIDDGKTAVIEMAQASGIELLTDDERDPFRATTYGTGELLQAALERGARRFIIGMGGSATVDGGIGALMALGVRFYDADGIALQPDAGRDLQSIAQIDPTGLDTRWRDCEIIIASDVDNPLLGAQGAVAVFGPQKGATDDDVPQLEARLRHVFTLIAEQHDADVRDIAGGGAAGGLSAGLLAFLGGRIAPGIDLLMQHNDFVAHLKRADLVITGEGQMDAQTVHGKGPIGVARLARQHGVATVALVGGLDVHDAILHEAGIQAVLPVVDQPMPLADALARATELVERAALRLGYVLQIKEQ